MEGCGVCWKGKEGIEVAIDDVTFFYPAKAAAVWSFSSDLQLFIIIQVNFYKIIIRTESMA